MRVLVTGGAGFIGSHLADAFLARGDEVSVADDLSAGRPSAWTTRWFCTKWEWATRRLWARSWRRPGRN